MSNKIGLIRAAWLACALAIAGLTLACVHRYRAYDAYYNDYHVWNDREVAFYQRWVNETHRDPKRDFRTLPPDEQEEYWKWRHQHSDHERH
jgi:hypothetical protein